MSRIQYDVEVIRQEDNPICWVANCAMVKGYGLQVSIGVGEFTDGFDPSNSCIANLAENWKECTDLMAGWGFNVLTVAEICGGKMLEEDLAKVLELNGPAVLLHRCKGFPYGSQYGDSSSFSGAHAVVLTGADTDAGKAYFNNPWGDKDQPADLKVLVKHINKDVELGKTFGFWPH